MRMRQLISSISRSPRPVARVAAVTTAAALAAAALAAAPATAADSGSTAPRGSVEVRVRVADNPLRTLASRADRPVGVLRDAGIERTPFDRVLLMRDGRLITAPGNKDVKPSDTVKLVRIGRHVTFKRHLIKRGTVVHKTTKLKPGVRKVVAPGRPGIRQAKVVRWTRNGAHLRTDFSHRVLRAPKPRQVLVGVKPAAGAGLNWGALAHCESGGNPRAVNPAGYYGLYQFSVGTWRSVGGHGLPSQASPAEQTHRAQILYARSGRSPWPYCGRFL